MEIHGAKVDRARAGSPGTPESAPSAPRAVRAFSDLRGGEHLCCLYGSDEEHRATLTPFLRQGLERGEKVVYVADGPDAERVLGYLRDDGLDLEPFRTRGQLAIVRRDESSFRDKLFDPVQMITQAREEADRAAEAGYPALRVAEDRTWALPGLPTPVRLAEFEKQLDALLRKGRGTALCLYDRRRFQAAMLLDVLPAHPWVVIDAVVCENLRYVPADDLPTAERPAAELQRWLGSLIERARAAEALAQEQFLMHTLMANIPDSIYFKDKDSRFLRASKGLARMFGLEDAAELIGKSDFDFFTKEHAQQAYDDEQAIIREGRPVTKEERETWADRPDTWASTTKVPLRDEAGNPVGTFGISRDITAHKNAEAESARLIGELRTALARLERLNALLPVCPSCKKVRDDAAYLDQLQALIRDHAEADASHRLCPECAKVLHPGADAAGAAAG
jgi:PAS domain S-box-containing protein